jgi:hypothetical protein
MATIPRATSLSVLLSPADPVVTALATGKTFGVKIEQESLTIDLSTANWTSTTSEMYAAYSRLQKCVEQHLAERAACEDRTEGTFAPPKIKPEVATPKAKPETPPVVTTSDKLKEVLQKNLENGVVIVVSTLTEKAVSKALLREFSLAEVIGIHLGYHITTDVVVEWVKGHLVNKELTIEQPSKGPLVIRPTGTLPELSETEFSRLYGKTEVLVQGVVIDAASNEPL